MKIKRVTIHFHLNNINNNIKEFYRCNNVITKQKCESNRKQCLYVFA